MNVITCFGCPLRVPAYGKRCQILDDRLKIVRPAKLTAIAFECATKRDLFRPGQPVKFKVYEDKENSAGDRMLKWVNGWVWKWDDRKVVIASSETRVPVLKLYPRRLTATDGEWKRCCSKCGKPEGVADRIKGRDDDEAHDYVCRWVEEEMGDGYYEAVDYPCVYRKAKR